MHEMLSLCRYDFLAKFLPYYFIPKSKWIPLVSVLNNFIKIYSNTMKYGLQ